jgi:signal transduction histidine kinase
VALLAPLPGLTPARVLHVLRILQEAVTNAIRHGRARQLWFSAADADDGATLVLRDDGSGFDGAAQPTGRGLKNMHRRAAECGATLAVHSVPGHGTTVTLRLPRC